MMRESDVEQYLVKRVKERGGEIRKAQWLDRRGAPDRIVLFPVARLYFVELKAPGEKPEPHQAREHKRLRRLGFNVRVIDTKIKVDIFLAGIPKC